MLESAIGMDASVEGPHELERLLEQQMRVQERQLAWARLGMVVLAGMLLAVPIVALSGRRRLGAAARTRRWFLTPDEIAPPPELAGLEAPDDARAATTRRAGAGLLAPTPLRP